jgi:hypothetical protein
MRPTREEARAREKLFPHANSWSWAGSCLVKETGRRRVSFCPECRKAEAAWMAQHKGVK